MPEFSNEIEQFFAEIYEELDKLSRLRVQAEYENHPDWHMENVPGRTTIADINQMARELNARIPKMFYVMWIKTEQRYILMPKRKGEMKF